MRTRASNGASLKQEKGAKMLKTFYFQVWRKPYSVPLILHRDAYAWEDILAEFPDAEQLTF